MINSLAIEIKESKRKPHNKTMKDIDKLKNNMLIYNSNFVKNYKKFSIFLKDKKNKNVKGGLCGYIQSGVMFVETFIIDENLRRKKLGTKILQTAEKIAKKNNCNCIYLDTFNFQALSFYQKLGYEIFSKLDDYDDGIVLYWLKKKLK